MGHFVKGLNMEKEEWKSVVGYEGYFEVSNYGKVRSLPRDMIKSNGKVQKVQGQEKLKRRTFDLATAITSN